MVRPARRMQRFVLHIGQTGGAIMDYIVTSVCLIIFFIYAAVIDGRKDKDR